jgi:hypothetical protein
MRGIPGGKIRPWDSWLISIRVESGQVGRTSGAFVMCKRSPAGLRSGRWIARTASAQSSPGYGLMARCSVSAPGDPSA